MCSDREIIRMIVKEECAEELEKIKKENKEIEKENKEIEKENNKIRTTLKQLKKQYDLGPDAEKIIDSILAI